MSVDISNVAQEEVSQKNQKPYRQNGFFDERKSRSGTSEFCGTDDKLRQ